VWWQEEDNTLVKERRDEYEQLKETRLGKVAEQNRQQGARKGKDNDTFATRQAERLAAEAAEAERLNKWRLDSIEQNKVDYHMDMREGEPGYGPTRWCWPTAHHHPRQCATGIDVRRATIERRAVRLSRVAGRVVPRGMRGGAVWMHVCTSACPLSHAVVSR
jgi:hypothetical protein